jgi:hypothetical protein
VEPHSTWDGWVVFTSPAGSGIFNKLDGKEDLAVQITMTRQAGGTVAGQITARTMFSYGLNITRVGAESFTAATRACGGTPSPRSAGSSRWRT